MNRFIIEQAVELSMATGHVPCLLGDTGVGKTDMGSIIAKRNNRELIKVELSLQNTEDLIGYPYKSDDGKMHWAAPFWFPHESEEDKYIIFVDELNRTNKDVLNAIMPMMLAKQLHEHKLPKGTWIMTAMNPDSEEFDLVYSFDDAAFIARFIFIEVMAEFSSWEKWLRNKNKYDDKVISFLKKHPELFIDEVRNVMNINIKPKPRVWTQLIDILHYCKNNHIQPLDALDIIIRGMVGQKAAVQFASVLDTYFDNKDLSMLFLEDLSNETALSISNEIIQQLNTGKELTTPNIVAEWFYRNAETHPAVLRRMLTEIDSGIDELYREQKFLDSISIITNN
jgi:hypothetical protein